MDFVKIEHCENVALLILSRGEVNAINNQMVKQLQAGVSQACADSSIRAVVLASDRPRFFSVGLDVNEVFQYDRRKIREFFGCHFDKTENLIQEETFGYGF